MWLLSQIMNLKENELDQLAKFMGHDIRVHREFYWLTENTFRLAKMRKLLMAIEIGPDVYKGKSLDEIDLGLGGEYKNDDEYHMMPSEVQENFILGQDTGATN